MLNAVGLSSLQISSFEHGPAATKIKFKNKMYLEFGIVEGIYAAANSTGTYPIKYSNNFFSELPIVIVSTYTSQLGRNAEYSGLSKSGFNLVYQNGKNSAENGTISYFVFGWLS